MTMARKEKKTATTEPTSADAKPKFVLPSGLRREEFFELYKLADIRTLKPRDPLIKEGEADEAAYLILSGQLRVLKMINGKLERIATLKPGQWVGEISLIRKVKRTASAVAIKPSVVMGITSSILSAVNEKTQLFLYKYFASLSARRIQLLEEKEKELQDSNERLVDNLLTQRLVNKIDASDSELIHDVIKKVPRLPTFAQTSTLNVIGDDVSLSRVAKQIKEDPPTVSAILKIVNSAYYGFKGKISDVHHAIVLFGYNTLNRLIISEGIRRTMPDTPVFAALHTHSLAIAELSFVISQNSHKSVPAEVSTFGLIHDLGKIIIEYLKTQNPKLAVLVRALDSAQLGSMLFKEWNFPEDLCLCTQYQSYPEFALPANIPKEALETVSIVYIAHLCYDVLADESDPSKHYPFLDDYLEVLGWEGLSIDQIVERHMLETIRERRELYPSALKRLFSSVSSDKAF